MSTILVIVRHGIDLRDEERRVTSTVPATPALEARLPIFLLYPRDATTR